MSGCTAYAPQVLVSAHRQVNSGQVNSGQVNSRRPPEQTGCYDRRHGMLNAPLLSDRTSDDDFARLIDEIRACRLCAADLPLGPRPIVRGRPEARLLIISQAPGTRVHETGLSFDDRSGDRLRLWLGLDRETFYDESRVALMGLCFCYRGRAQLCRGRPPRPGSAPL